MCSEIAVMESGITSSAWAHSPGLSEQAKSIPGRHWTSQGQAVGGARKPEQGNCMPLTCPFFCLHHPRNWQHIALPQRWGDQKTAWDSWACWLKEWIWQHWELLLLLGCVVVSPCALPPALALGSCRGSSQSPLRWVGLFSRAKGSHAYRHTGMEAVIFFRLLVGWGGGNSVGRC